MTESWAGQDVFLSELQANSLAWPLPVLLSWLVTHCPQTSLWQYRLQLLLSQPAAADNFSRKDTFLQYSYEKGISTNPKDWWKWTSGYSQASCSLWGWGSTGVQALARPTLRGERSRVTSLITKKRNHHGQNQQSSKQDLALKLHSFDSIMPPPNTFSLYEKNNIVPKGGLLISFSLCMKWYSITCVWFNISIPCAGKRNLLIQDLRGKPGHWINVNPGTKLVQAVTMPLSTFPPLICIKSTARHLIIHLEV